MFHVVYEGASGVEGYVAYRVNHDWAAPLGGGILKVVELMATTPDAYRGVWTYCFSVDLVSRIQARHRPIDDPLPWMLADYRRLDARPSDALWLRLVDVDAALSARHYSAEGNIVFEVADANCPWNAGRHHLDAGPDGATSSPTDAEPDLRLDVRDLGAAYLGGVELRSWPMPGASRSASRAPWLAPTTSSGGGRCHGTSASGDAGRLEQLTG